LTKTPSSDETFRRRQTQPPLQPKRGLWVFQMNLK
jgi:hypothetical protein